eukprot:PhM_4_TR14420/c0_g1_i1/m.24299
MDCPESPVSPDRGLPSSLLLSRNEYGDDLENSNTPEQNHQHPQHSGGVQYVPYDERLATIRQRRAVDDRETKDANRFRMLLYKEKFKRAAENRLHGVPEVRTERCRAWLGILSSTLVSYSLSQIMLRIQAEMKLQRLMFPAVLRLLRRTRRKLTMRALAAENALPRMPDLQELARTNRWLQFWPEENVKKLIKHARPYVLFEGEPMYYEHERSGVLFILCEGEVEMYRRKQSPNALVQIKTVTTPGTIFGIGGLLAGEPESVSVRCLTRVLALRIPRDDAVATLNEVPYITRSKILRSVVDDYSMFLGYVHKLDPATLERSSALFRGWGSKLLHEVCREVQIRSNIPDDVVFSPRDYGRLGIIIRGTALLNIRSDKGHIESSRVLGPGSVFGEPQLFHSVLRTAKHVEVVATSVLDAFYILSTNVSRVLVGHVEAHRLAMQAADKLIVDLVAPLSENDIQKTKPFDRLPLKTIRTLLTRFTPCVYHERMLIYDEERPVITVLYVAYGHVKVVKAGQPDSEQVVGAGSLIGVNELSRERSFLPGGDNAHHHHAGATTDEAHWTYSVFATQGTIVYFAPKAAVIQHLPREKLCADGADLPYVGVLRGHEAETARRAKLQTYTRQMLIDSQHKSADRVKEVQRKAHRERRAKARASIERREENRRRVEQAAKEREQWLIQERAAAREETGHKYPDTRPALDDERRRFFELQLVNSQTENDAGDGEGVDGQSSSPEEKDHISNGIEGIGSKDEDNPNGRSPLLTYDFGTSQFHLAHPPSGIRGTAAPTFVRARTPPRALAVVVAERREKLRAAEEEKTAELRAKLPNIRRQVATSDDDGSSVDDPYMKAKGGTSHHLEGQFEVSTPAFASIVEESLRRAAAARVAQRREHAHPAPSQQVQQQQSIQEPLASTLNANADMSRAVPRPPEFASPQVDATFATQQVRMARHATQRMLDDLRFLGHSKERKKKTTMDQFGGTTMSLPSLQTTMSSFDQQKKHPVSLQRRLEEDNAEVVRKKEEAVTHARRYQHIVHPPRPPHIVKPFKLIPDVVGDTNTIAMKQQQPDKKHYMNSSSGGSFKRERRHLQNKNDHLFMIDQTESNNNHIHF